jgi:hypothetical protein
MVTGFVRRAGVPLAFVVAASGASGQCQPAWETAIGNPGVAGGYAAPIFAWNSGSGENLYVGGSFTAMGGSAVNRYLARYNAGTNSWSALGSGINPGFTNAFMTSLVSFDFGSGPRLIAGGFFDNAGAVAQTASLAMWNGTSWEAMGTTWTGTTRGSIWSQAVWNGRLYVGGGVVNQPPTIAGMAWAGLASWNGTTWATHATSMAGFSPYIAALQVFDDGSGEALYAAGRFSAIDGVGGTSLIARFSGTSWSAVGGGLTSLSANFGLEGATLFDDGSGEALFVAGYAFVPPGAGTTNVAKWDGQSWTSLGGQIGTGRLTSIAAFDDGTGETLYIGGTAMPQINYIARWESGQWVPLGGGVTGPGIPPSTFPSVFGLGVWDGKLYAGGNFTQVNSVGANGIAAWAGCASCYPDCNTSGSLTIADFGRFQAAFAAGDPYADCNATGGLTIADFGCFQASFAAGCP